MSKQEFDELVSALYGAYHNIKKKREQEPLEFRQFRARLNIWKEW